MNCPYCQSDIPSSSTKCPVCGNKLATPNVLDSKKEYHSGVKKTPQFVCPTCQSPISLSDQFCSTCSSNLDWTIINTERLNVVESPRKSDFGEQTSSWVLQSKGENRKDDRNYGMGIIIGDPILLDKEPRDINPLRIAIATILLMELGGILLFISFWGLFLVLLLLLVAFFVRTTGLFLVSGCIGNIFFLPFTIIGRIANLLFGDVLSNNSSNLQSVKEYILDLEEGTVSTFVVKGNLSPRTLRRGDRVKVWTRSRNGRAFFRKGYLFEQNIWKPLRNSESSYSSYFLIGIFILFNLLILYAYFQWQG